MNFEFQEILGAVSIIKTSILKKQSDGSTKTTSNTFKSRQIFADLAIVAKDGKNELVPFIVDTGASMSLLPTKIVKRLGKLNKERNEFVKQATPNGKYLASLVTLQYSIPAVSPLQFSSTFGHATFSEDSKVEQFIKTTGRLIADFGKAEKSGLPTKIKNENMGILSLRDLTKDFDIQITETEFALRLKKKHYQRATNSRHAHFVEGKKLSTKGS